MFHASVTLAAVLIVTPVTAEVIVLKNGTFVEGKITVHTRTTITIDTKFGARTFARREIDEIVETVEDGDTEEVRDFAKLPPPVKAVLNARADYELGNYERALARIEPLSGYDQDPALRVRIDWLNIELNERVGRWEKAKRLLNQKVGNGMPRERVRAQAHLDIFRTNPKYDLRYVGRKHARNFIRDQRARDRAREPDSLRDRDTMRLALEEYCKQLLVEEKLSVKAFADGLDLEVTYNAIVEAGGTGDLTRRLPYIESLKRAEGSLLKAQAILGDYGAAFELDLARTELNHLLTVSGRLLAEAIQASPESYTPAANQRSGRLTGEGRRMWRERCEEFLEKARPLTHLYAYMVDKVDRYPAALRDLQQILKSQKDRFEEMVKAVRKAKGRTHV